MSNLKRKNFVDDLLAVYRKHRLALEHEDSNGGFVIREFTPGARDNEGWLQSAEWDVEDAGN